MMEWYSSGENMVAEKTNLNCGDDTDLIRSSSSEGVID